MEWFSAAFVKQAIRFTLNGTTAECVVAPHETLVDVLRDRFALGGPRESCGQGLCGCCTVLVDSAAVSGCLYLAVFADGAELVTVEGLADGDTLHPEQEAFIEAGAFQCGFCTPGIRADDDAAVGRASRPTTTRSVTTCRAICAAAAPIRRSSKR